MHNIACARCGDLLHRDVDDGWFCINCGRRVQSLKQNRTRSWIWILLIGILTIVCSMLALGILRYWLGPREEVRYMVIDRDGYAWDVDVETEERP